MKLSSPVSVKDQMLRISVCMATYNGAKYVDKQLKSILSQIGADDEIIISDDGSTDDTILIIEKIKDERIKVTRNRGINGPLGNFEQAVRKATGDYIFLSDQDDIWLPNKVSIIRSLLKLNDLVLSDCVVVNEKGEVLQDSFFNYRGSKPGFLSNIYKNSYIGCCMAFRRSILSYVLPFPESVHMHDWWIGLLVEIKGQVCFCPEPLIHYVRHGENASPTGEEGYGTVRRIQNRFNLLWSLFKRLFL